MENNTCKRRKRETPYQAAKRACIEKTVPDTLQKRFINNQIGFGLFTKEHVESGSFLCEYRGVHESADEDGEEDYFKHGKDYRIKPDSCMVMYVNDIDVNTKANCKMKMIDVDSKLHLGLFSISNIRKCRVAV